jgi:TonB family protein
LRDSSIPNRLNILHEFNSLISWAHSLPRPGIRRASPCAGVSRSTGGGLMRATCRKVLILGAVILLFTGSVGFAQQSSNGESKRKLRTKVTPAYPEVASRMHISGRVRFEITIAPDGKVRNVRLLGGNPVLAQAAQDALKEWRYYPGPEETMQIVEFEFHPPGS